VVAPKRQSLAEAESVYNENMSKLTLKRAELKAVTDKLLALQSNLNKKQMEKKVKGLINMLIIKTKIFIKVGRKFVLFVDINHFLSGTGG
jgi:hypothetical protein